MTEPAPSVPAIIGQEVARLLAPLAVLGDPAGAVRLIRELGFALPDDTVLTADFTNLLRAVEAALGALGELADAAEQEQAERLVTLLGKVKDLLRETDGVGERIRAALTGLQEFAEHSGIEADLPRRLLDRLVVEYLMAAQRTAYGLAIPLGLVEWQNLPAEPDRHRAATVLATVRWDRIPKLFTDPGGLAEEVLGWRSGLKAQPLLAAIGLILDRLGFAVGNHEQDPAIQAALGRPPGALELHVALVSEEADAAGLAVEGGLRLSELATTNGARPGIGVFPYLLGTADAETTAGGFTITLRATAELDGGVALLLRPPDDVTLTMGLLSNLTVAGETRVRVLWRTEPDRPILLLGSRDGSGATLGGVAGGLVVRSAVRAGQPTAEAAVEVEVVNLRVVLAAGEGDGFLQRILPPEGIGASVTVGIGLSTVSGLYLTGSGSVEVTLPVHASLLGVVRLDSVYLALRVKDSVVALDIAATFGANLGPLAVTVDRVGLTGSLAVRPQAGSATLTPALIFKPPGGAGLLIDAPNVTGGGSLTFDQARQEYTGVVQLELAGFGLSAVALITTRPGEFSLLVIISVEFSAIQLGYGFTLNGVGGLLGVNRTIAIEEIQNGLSQGALDSVLFPRDPVRNAAQLVATLNRFFPPAQGQYVIGPSVVLGWGTPTILTITLGVLIEFPSPVQVVLAGQLRMVLPDGEAQLVVINVDLLGSLDLTRRRLSVDASLRNSRVAGFALAGDMAVRFGWGDDPAFLMAAGGFNPRFKPPDRLRRLERLSLSLGTSDNPRLRLEAYLALTSNTVQFGARLDLYASADIVLGTFSVAASLGFDALFQFDPFAFVVDLYASVVLCWNDDPFLGVQLTCTLTGPEPWRARGEATFHFLGTHSVAFEIMIGDEPEPEPPRLVNVPAMLRAALADPRNWAAGRPAAGRSLVTLRHEAARGDLVVNPLGTLTVRQRVVPLDRRITRYGAARPTDPGPFTVSVLAPDGSRRAPDEVVTDDFARAQFLDLSDAERLAAPSFEPMPAGVRIGDGGVRLPTTGIRDVDDALIYEEYIVDVDDGARLRGPVTPTSVRLSDSDLPRLAAAGAAARNGVIASGIAPFVGVPLGLRVLPPLFPAVELADEVRR